MAVPEGLPLAVAICLSFSCGTLKTEEDCLIRSNDAAETMGGANEICTDKTGTLTTGKMVIRTLWINDNEKKPSEAVRNLKGDNMDMGELLC